MVQIKLPPPPTTTPGLGLKPIRGVFCVTAKLHLSQVSSCLCEENYRTKEEREKYFLVVFLFLYILRVSLLSISGSTSQEPAGIAHVFHFLSVFVLFLADWAESDSIVCLMIRKQRLKEHGQEPVCKKEKKA